MSGVICRHVVDLVCAGDNKFNQAAASGIKKDLQVGSADTKDMLRVGQRVCWAKTTSEEFVRHEKGRAIEELCDSV